MALVQHGLIQKAARDANDTPYRIEKLKDGYHVHEPIPALSRWKKVAWFATRRDLEDFLVGKLCQEDR